MNGSTLITELGDFVKDSTNKKYYKIWYKKAHFKENIDLESGAEVVEDEDNVVIYSPMIPVWGFLQPIHEDVRVSTFDKFLTKITDPLTHVSRDRYIHFSNPFACNYDYWLS